MEVIFAEFCNFVSIYHGKRCIARNVKLHFAFKRREHRRCTQCRFSHSFLSPYTSRKKLTAKVQKLEYHTIVTQFKMVLIVYKSTCISYITFGIMLEILLARRIEGMPGIWRMGAKAVQEIATSSAFNGVQEEEIIFMINIESNISRSLHFPIYVSFDLFLNIIKHISTD